MVKTIKKILSYLRFFRSFLKYAYNDFKRKYWYQYFPTKPTVINLNANDFCNSGCKMCNIWKLKKDFEFSPDQLRGILSDKLFNKVTHVGITGGEPTLRDDLLKIYEAVIDVLPALKGVSIITNSIEVDSVYEKIINISQLCLKRNVDFSVMVSLDGVGRVHDLNRGIEGNFNSAIKLINLLRHNTKIPLSIGCTITKLNVWKLDELLTFLRGNNIYGRFRIAEFIKRLYNENNKNFIRSFNADELYHLQLFFHKIMHTFEKNNIIQRTYSSIFNMLGGGHREIGCPYHTKGIVLNATGQIAYCAPKSSILGSTIKDSAYRLWTKNLNERRRIQREECLNCIHDYHAPLTFSEYKEEVGNKLSKKLTRYHYKEIIKLRKVISHLYITNKSVYTVFIVGWYGTETVGDKAILGGIIKSYQKKYNNCKFIIGSLYPFITQRTVKELKIDAKVVDSTKPDLIKYSSIANETVMGGGPLMDLDVLYVPEIAFYTAKKFNKTTTVFGCGIGPLKNKIETVRSILNMSSNIKVRDSKSQLIASEWTKRTDIEMYGDPAKDYLLDRYKNITVTPKNELACFLREWTQDYSNGLEKDEFLIKRTELESLIAEKIRQLIEDYGIEKIRLYHMHNFHVGNDDRDFSRRFIKTYFPNDKRISYDEKLSTIESIVTAIKNSKLNLCMRFHSVLFAHTLKTNFFAIDYTFGGKIYKFLADNNKLELIIHLNVKKNESCIN